jgi:hypothetical protein
MRKVKYYKCPHCGVKYKSLQTWGNHVSNVHPELIPSGWSYSRYFYYVLTGKNSRPCDVCKKDTPWNEATQKYEKFCTNPECKEKYREIFKSRMMKKYGKVHLLNDPEQQRKMLANRKISGLYTFKNGKQIGYVGSYEKDFLYMLDRFLYFDPNDIMMPSPHTYEYDYKNPNDKENEGKRFFIPDAYIPSINLEIEIKQNTNTHPKLLMIDKVKELQKDDLMKTLPDVNYIKIVEKDYGDFFKLIYELANSISEDRTDIATESSIKFEKKDESYVSKGKRRLSEFKIGKLDKYTVNGYKSVCPSLAHVRVNPYTSGEIVVDGDKIVGYYQTEKKDNCVWLQAYEICNDYRGYKLGNHLFSRAVRFGKITNLAVDIKNEVAIDLYRKHGFVEYSRNNTMIFMMKP